MPRAPILERRLVLIGLAGLALIGLAAGSDFFLRHFWLHHAMLTSLIANLLVVGVTLAVFNQLLERRDRQRWSLLAQSVMFELLQSARATWTGLLEALGLGPVGGGDVDGLLEAARLARDPDRVSPAVRKLLAEDDQRAVLQRFCLALSEHYSEVIARWAPVMIGARPYAEAINGHVELADRLEWLTRLLAHVAPGEEDDIRQRVLTRTSVATEQADRMGSDDALHAQILAAMRLATDLDYESREHGYALVPMSWWQERTSGLSGQTPPEPDEVPGSVE